MAAEELPHLSLAIQFSLQPTPIRDEIIGLLQRIFPSLAITEDSTPVLPDPGLPEDDDLSSSAPLSNSAPLATSTGSTSSSLLQSSSAAALQNLKMKRLTGGITNVLFKVTLPSGECLNVRLYGPGSSDVIDRDVEKHNMIRLSKASLAPRLHATFENGCVYEFVRGKLPKLASLGKGKYDQRLAVEIGRWHGNPELISEEEKRAEAKVWVDVDDWLPKAKQLNPPADRFDIAKAEELYNTIRLICQQGEHSVGFCHNDLLPGNIVLKPCGGLTFIDVEYAGKNYHLFDIANHFAERVVDYSAIATKWDCYPSADQQRLFFQQYIEQRDRSPATDDQVAKLIKDLPLFSSLSCLYWAIWAIIQSTFSEEKQFDYLTFAVLRFSMSQKFFQTYQASL